MRDLEDVKQIEELEIACQSLGYKDRSKAV
jgi:hypothetical protein